jgi:hypothetical protein
MPKLNQIIAIESGVRSNSVKELSDAHHALLKPALLHGIARTYTPKDDEGDKLPAEATKVQVIAPMMLKQSAQVWTRLFDITLTRDAANCAAKANVVVDGVVLIKDAPVTFLLFLEKKLVDVETFIRKLPTLDPAETWAFDKGQDCYATPPVETVKTKKIPRVHIKYEATKEHPAQVESYGEDVVVGTWRTVKYSGALPGFTQTRLLEQVIKLREAVKMAREEANGIEVDRHFIGEELFKFLLAPIAVK